MLTYLPILDNGSTPPEVGFDLNWAWIARKASENLLLGGDVSPAGVVASMAAEAADTPAKRGETCHQIVRRNRRANLETLQTFYSSLPHPGSLNQGGLEKWERKHADVLVSPPSFEGISDAEYVSNAARLFADIRKGEVTLPDDDIAPEVDPPKGLVGADAEAAIEEVAEQYTPQEEGVDFGKLRVSADIAAIMADDEFADPILSNCESLDSLDDHYDDLDDDYIRRR